MSQTLNPSRFAVLGASRGLGAAVVQELKMRFPGASILGLARNPSDSSIQWVTADISRPEEQERVLQDLTHFTPHRLICTLGGGPYGLFQEKAWRDHQWCFDVSFLFQARVVHWGLSPGSGGFLQQLIVVGSSVAEDKPDPRASSYSAAKHALKGLVLSVRAEQPKLDVRLYSPGYMDTGLLPPAAQARQQPIWKPQDVAKDLVDWMERGERFDHRRLAVRPEGR